MHHNSMLLFNKHARNYFSPGMNVLEIGARIPSAYKESLGDIDLDWNYLDIDGAGIGSDLKSMERTEELDYHTIDNYNFAIDSDTFDVVLSGQVLEHVPKAWVWIKELARVTKSGGYVITLNPVSWPYHEAPVDCWRIFPEGMRALYENAGLEVELCLYDCLESSAKRIIPGAGLDCQPLKRKLGMKFMSMFGFPIEASYDIVTVGKKK